MLPSFPPTVRVPDVVVTYNEIVEQKVARLDVAEVLLAVEVVSPDSKKTDQILKPVEYAEAGIPHYWLVDIDEPAVTLTAYLLVDGYYEIVADTDGSATLSVPTPVTVNMRTLLNRRR